MLRKLIKLDFNSMGRTLKPLIIGLFIAGVFCGLFFGISMRLDTKQMSGIGSALLGSVTVLCVLGFTFGTIGAYFTFFILVYSRFYKNLMTDQGYLSFTLPVTPTEHICSKLITVVLWEIIFFAALIVTLLAGLLVFVFVGGALNEITWSLVSRFIASGFDELVKLLSLSSGWLLLIETLISLLIQTIASTLLVYLSITIACVTSSKNRIWLSIAVYIGINFAMSTVISVIALPLSSVLTLTKGVITGPLLASMIINLISATVCFLITKTLLEKKLNL